MSDLSVLYYATPPRPVERRPNALAVFAFVWTVVVTPATILLFLRGREWAAGALAPPVSIALGVGALIVAPAVAVISGYIATERGAGWDSPYRWTALAVVAVPVASVITSVGVMYWVRGLL